MTGPPVRDGPARLFGLVTAVLMPDGHDAERCGGSARALQRVARRRSRALQGRVFRIGHMGDLNEPISWARWPRSRWL